MTEVAMRVAAADRFFLLLEGTQPPPSCVWAFVLDGARAPDPQRLRSAVAAALAVHAKAACRVAHGSRWRMPVWEPVPRLDLDSILEARRAPAAGEGGLLDDVVSRFHHPFNVSAGPLLRLEWRQIGAADGALVFHFHHALGDGPGSLAFLRDVIRACEGLPIEESRAVPIAARRRLGGLLRYSFAQARPVSFHAPDHVYDPQHQPTGRLELAYRAVPLQILEAAMGARDAPQTAVLAAAVALAIARFRRERSRHIRIAVSVSLRPPAGRPGLDNQSAAISISLAPAHLADPGGLAARIHDGLRFARRHGVAETVAAFAPPVWVPTALAAPFVKRLARAHTLDSLFLANVGALSVSGEPVDAWIAPFGGHVRRVWVLSRPAEGTGATLNVAAAGGAVHLNLCFLQGLLDRADAERLLDLVVASIQEQA